jgi:hypothetical protein
MAEPKILGVREILSSFRSTLTTARQTGEPVTPAPAAAPTGAGAGVIALRHRKPAGVLLGYETWQAMKAQLPVQADTSALQAELATERQRNSELAAELADTRRQAEDMGCDLAAARQRVAELEAQLARPSTANQRGEAWGVESLPEPVARLPETWASWSSGGSGAARAASEVRLEPIVSGTCAGFSDANYRAW